MKRNLIRLHSGSIGPRSCLAFVLLVSLAMVISLPYVAHAALIPLKAEHPGNGNPPSDPGNGNGNPPSDPGNGTPSDPPGSSSDVPDPAEEASPSASPDNGGHEGSDARVKIRTGKSDPKALLLAGHSFTEQIMGGIVGPGVMADQMAANLNGLLIGEHPVSLELSLPVLRSAAVTTSKDYALPLVLAVLVILYLLIQWRIDRRDPKMAFVRLQREEEVVFE